MVNNKIIAILLLLQIVLAFNVYAAEVSELNIYVCANETNSGDGTLEKPFNSLEKARDYIRTLKRKGPLGFDIKVMMREGVYYLDKSFELTDKDSGTQEHPIIYTAYPDEEVVLSGGKNVDMSKASYVNDKKILSKLPEESRDKVIEVNLKAQGIVGLGNIAQVSYGIGHTPEPDLLWDGEIQKIARWPEEDYATVGTILYGGYVLFSDATRFQPRADDPGFIFKTDAPRAHLWPNAKDAWLYGYWNYNWAADSVRVKNVVGDLVFTKTSASFGVNRGAWYYIYNLLEELDQPGEWYIDSDTDILYVYPPSPIVKDTEVIFTYLNEPAIRMTNTSDVRIENITFAVGKSTAVSINGGSRTEIAGCTFRNFNSTAIIIRNAYRSGVISCDLYNLGAAGIDISSGDRNNLVPQGCYAVNNLIHNFARVGKVYNPAIKLGGVGNYAAYNKIYNSPHMAIGFSGNDHIVEYNHISDVLKEASDAGAIYVARDLLAYGNIIRYNYIDNIRGAGMRGAAVGIYFDDMWSGTASYGNIVNNTDMPFLIGGGRDNTITNNIVMNSLESSEASLSLDSRGTGWAAKNISVVYDSLAGASYTNKIWQQRYPEASRIMDDGPDLPKHNVVRNNVIYNHSSMDIEDNFETYSDVSDNLFLDSEDDIGFVDEENGNFTLREDSIVFKRLPEFKPIPFENIGLYVDGYRKNVEK